MSAIPIPERTWRKDVSRVLSDMNSWLSALLEKAYVQASIELSDDGWFVVKGEGAKFTVNLLNKLCYYPVSVGEEERTAKVFRVEPSKTVHVAYPNRDGRTEALEIPVKEIMARLGVKGVGRSEFVKTFGIVERLPISVLPREGGISELTVNFFMNFLRSGLDVVLALDLTPIEAEELIGSRSVSDNVVEVKALTPLSYAFSVKLGVEPSSVRALLSEAAETFGARPFMPVLRWEEAAALKAIYSSGIFALR